MNRPADQNALVVESLHVTYGDFVAVQDATFTISPGECAAMVGPNGNGKSSIALALVGLIPSRGKVEVFGETAPRGNATWAVRHGLTLVPERRQLFPRMTVQDNILLGCYAWTKSMRKARTSEAYASALDLFPEVQVRLKQLAGTLSGGEAQMVALARGLAADPKILIADEPCLGLAEIISRRLYEALQGLNKEGKTIILIEENPVRALEIANHVVRVERGTAVDTPVVSNPATAASSTAQAGS